MPPLKHGMAGRAPSAVALAAVWWYFQWLALMVLLPFHPCTMAAARRSSTSTSSTELGSKDEDYEFYKGLEFLVDNQVCESRHID